MTRRLAAALAGGAALLLAIGACSSGKGSTDSKPGAGGNTVNLEYLPYTGSAPLMLGVKQGIFAKHDVKLKLTKSTSAAGIVASLVNGEQNIGFTPVVNLITARSHGTDIKCLATDQGTVDPSNSKATLLLVKKGSSITSPKGLAGKTIGVAGLNGLNHLFALSEIKQAGGDWTKTHVIALPLPEAQSALESGRVDAVVGNLPYTTAMLDAGAVSLASQEVSYIPGGTGACWAATDKWLAGHEKQADAFVAANTESLDYAKGHVAAAMATLPTFLSLTAKEAAETKPASIYDPTFNKNSVTKQMNDMVTFKFIPKPLPLTDIIYKNGQ